MNTILTISVIIVALTVITYMIRMAFILQKSRIRKGDLAHLIQQIRDPSGYSFKQAEKYYRECEHICEHYGLTPNDVTYLTGFTGDLADLWADVEKSALKAEAREKRALEHEKIDFAANQARLRLRGEEIQSVRI